jgi:hypothetical protein
MTRSSIRTLLPLDTFAAILGLDPWEFAGASFEPPRSKAQCTALFKQFVWQHDFIAREEVGETIAQAEQMIADALGYWPAPKYFVDEVVQYPRPYERELWGGAGTHRGEWKAVQTLWKRVISGGIFNRTSLQANVAVTKVDADSDQVFEGFSLTIATTITDPAQIAIYFTANDRLSAPLDETWRIRPITVTFSGGVATITGHRSQLIKPELQNALSNPVISVTDEASYVDQVDVTRVFTDTTATDSNPYQGIAIWNVLPPQATDGSFAILPLTLGQLDARSGQVLATFGAPSTWPFNREPDRLQVNYVAGAALDADGQVDHELARVIAYLTVALLPTEKCGCERSNRIIDHWRKPLSERDKQRLYTQKEIDDNPFAAIPTEGSLYAWKRVQRWRSLGVVSL